MLIWFLLGSTRAGKLITKNAADTIKRVCLELGGKGGNIVFADSYPDAVRDGIRNVMSNWDNLVMLQQEC